MAYLTENRLSDVIDIPISLPATSLMMGDWLVVTSVVINTPMRLSCRLLGLQILSSTVSIANIAASNQIYGNLGLVYAVLRKDYMSGNPGGAGGLDSLIATNIGLYNRDITAPVYVTDPGTYSWIIANNTQPSSDPAALIAQGTSIDFTVTLTGAARLEMSFTS